MGAASVASILTTHRHTDLALDSNRGAGQPARVALEPCTLPGAEGEVRCGRYEVFENRQTSTGTSYGTRATLVYVRRHREHVRSMSVAPTLWPRSLPGRQPKVSISHAKIGSSCHRSRCRNSLDLKNEKAGRASIRPFLLPRLRIASIQPSFRTRRRTSRRASARCWHFEHFAGGLRSAALATEL